MPEKLCRCEDWFPHYEQSAHMCWDCDLPLSKERSDIAAKFWETCCPGDFRQAACITKVDFGQHSMLGEVC
jgi:hypothetical protein